MQWNISLFTVLLTCCYCYEWGCPLRTTLSVSHEIVVCYGRGGPSWSKKMHKLGLNMEKRRKEGNRMLLLRCKYSHNGKIYGTNTLTTKALFFRYLHVQFDEQSGNPPSTVFPTKRFLSISKPSSVTRFQVTVLPPWDRALPTRHWTRSCLYLFLSLYVLTFLVYWHL